MTRLRRALAQRDEGASAVEYALILAGMVAVCIVIVFATFEAARALYGKDCQNVGTNGLTSAQVAPANVPAACS